MRIALVNLCRDNAGLLPTGLLCLRSYLLSKLPGHTVDFADAAVEDPFAKIVAGRYDIVGISSMTPQYEDATILAKNIRAVLPETVIVLGGTHITKLPQSFRHCFDVGILGDGEAGLVELVELIGELPAYWRQALKGLRGCVYMEESGPALSPPRQPLDLKNYPPLDYSILHPSYWRRRAMPNFADFGVEATLMTSRGCPYKCVFCASGNLWSKLRFFSEEWVIGEMQALIARGVTHLSIFDDVFAVNKSRLERIGNLMWHYGITDKLTLYCNCKADAFDQEIIDLLKKMNCRHIFFGFESGSERNLQYLKAGKVHVTDNMRAVELAASRGMLATGNVILGSPGETREEMQQTIDFIHWFRRHGGNRMLASVMTPFPGTPLWERAKTMGRVKDEMDFSTLGMNSVEDYEGGFVVDTMSREEFTEIFHRVLAAIHPFKRRKAIQFLTNAPAETLRFAAHAPWRLIRRLFDPSMT